MYNKMLSINDDNIPYNPLLQSSNSFVSELLHVAGIDAVLPVQPDGHPVWAPGFGRHLLESSPFENYYGDLIWDYLSHYWSDNVQPGLERLYDEAVQRVGDFLNSLGALASGVMEHFDQLKDMLADILG